MFAIGTHPHANRYANTLITMVPAIDKKRWRSLSLSLSLIVKIIAPGFVACYEYSMRYAGYAWAHSKATNIDGSSTLSTHVSNRIPSSFMAGGRDKSSLPSVYSPTSTCRTEHNTLWLTRVSNCIRKTSPTEMVAVVLGYQIIKL